MWFIENEKIRLDISKINKDFKITTEDGLHLIYPRKNKWDWEDEEKCLRSVVVDNDGFVVSSGWKKFGNYGEFERDTKSLISALRCGEVHFTEKIDGSLSIRYIYNNKVIFRTRGTLFGGQDNEDNIAYGERFRKVAESKYPILLDPKLFTDRSLLFEYVAPSNLVVIRYTEEDLIFLGYVNHSNLENGKWREVKSIADKYKLNLVKLHDLPREPKELLEQIKTWKDEGIVARCNDDQVFVKIKSAYYLANHRMKYSMKYLTMVEFIEGGEVKTEQQLVDSLRECEYDWEIIESAKEFYNRYIKAVELKDKALFLAREFYNNFNYDGEKPHNYQTKMEYQRLRKKQYASQLNKMDLELARFVRPMAFALYDDKQQKINNLCRKIILTEGK